ncbi:serine/threonine-protein kinase [Actinomadura verrucosospora]|uniref:non-specific serine/threonine protein kinase n=1 Tax=Actinomadura verrucosospora TaxID=46165 RepID=A0A7D4A9F0_ACTVE|nr:serine/threonine-protein kinase [Actinomadura verrucosospora]QKG25685.1 protein serine or threonine kinase [Actinomadura verrucosospora]
MPRTIHDGRYELLDELGRGGMGVVWRARDTLLGREVAVKEVTPPRGLDGTQAERVNARTIREARAAARLRHAGIVTVHDVVLQDGRPWIVMDLVEAPGLDAVIRREGPLPPDRVARIGLDLLDALRAAHEADVVHRDVKPANVLLGAKHAVLTDFGVATMTGEDTLTQTGAIVGSPAYLSPEQARREDATPASDLWSLGATLYAAVEGRRPYERPDIYGLMGALLQDEPDPPRRAGPLGPVLHGLLRRDPGERLGHDEAERLLRAAAAPPAPGRDVHDPTVGPSPNSSPAPVPPAPGPPGPPPAGPHPNPEPSGLDKTIEPSDQRTLPPHPVPPRPAPGPGPSPSPFPPAPGPGLGPEPGPRRRRRWELIVPAGIFAAALVAAAVVLAVFLGDGGNGGPGRTHGTRPSSTASPGVPAGYHQYRGSAFLAAVPDGWKADGEGDGVTFTAPEQGATRGVAVTRAKPGPFDTSDPGDALAQAAKDFAGKDSGYTDYRQVSFDRNVSYRGGKAAELEFTFTENAKPARARVRVFPFDGALYQVILAADQDHWDETVPAYETLLSTFRPSS